MPEFTNTQPTPRAFAFDVVKRLRDAGFEALWAGGCVRDDLLGITPKDYDVATSATPDQVIELFGKRRTVPVGVSFGVVMVLGPQKSCGQVEVATFRADGEYQDGRRPDSVKFCGAKEDAQRRDFTINGMFYDPVQKLVIDYVGGQQDLRDRMVRAIGDPVARFTEDKLRMLRAVRFAATYEFALDAATAQAVRDLRSKITQVSAERIAQELRRMLSHRTRSVAFQQLVNVKVLDVLFPDVFATEDAADKKLTQLQNALASLTEPTFEPSLSLIFRSCFDAQAETWRSRAAGIMKQCRQLKLSNDECATVCWIAESAHCCRDAGNQPLHVIKPILADERRTLLIDYLRAIAVADGKEANDADYLANYAAANSPDVLNPEPFVTGADLQTLGVKPGPQFKKLLTTIRQEQLDEQLETREGALQRLTELLPSM